jgi:hypothetical protein
MYAMNNPRFDLPPLPMIADEEALATARKGVTAIAKNNAVQRLLDTAQIILDSMSIVDQPSLHARLRSDIAALKSFSPES